MLVAGHDDPGNPYVAQVSAALECSTCTRLCSCTRSCIRASVFAHARAFPKPHFVFCFAQQAHATDGTKLTLGYFATFDEAARAYARHAKVIPGSAFAPIWHGPPSAKTG